MSNSSDWERLAIQLAAAGLGAAVGGPVGGIVGGWLGNRLGGPASDLISSQVKVFGAKAGEKLFEVVGDSAAKNLQDSGRPLDDLFREVLRSSLASFPSSTRLGFEDWFDNWNACLSQPLQSGHAIAKKILQSTSFDILIKDTLETLDARGAAVRSKSISIELQSRNLPDRLFSNLKTRLPRLVDDAFHHFVVQPQYDPAWKHLQMTLLQGSSAKLDSIADTVDRIELTSRDIKHRLSELYDIALRKRTIEDNVSDKDTEISRLNEELRQLRELVARSSESEEKDLEALLNKGDFQGAIHLKKQQAEKRENEVHRLAKDYFELGTLHDLVFEWPAALNAFRKAWQLERNPHYGERFAHIAHRQHSYNEAIDTYEALLEMASDPVNRSMVLNSLGNLYREVSRIEDAEKGYKESLLIRRELARVDPLTQLPQVAMTLNNLGVLYQDLGKRDLAEGAFKEALPIRRQFAQSDPENNLPSVATILTNLGTLYSKVGVTLSRRKCS